MGKLTVIKRENIMVGGTTYDTFLVEPDLEHIDVQMEDGLIKVDIKSSGQGVKKLAGSFQVKEIRCLPGKLAVKVIPFSSSGR